MPFTFSEPAAHTDLPPLVIPNFTTLPTVPSTHVNDHTSCSSITPPDALGHSHAPFLLLPHDEERSQRTFGDSESTMEESAHDKHTYATIDHLDTVVHRNLGLVVEDANTCGKLDLFHIPHRSGNTSTPPTSRWMSVGVARRNRIFALDNIGGVRTQPEELGASAALQILAVETEGSSAIEADGEVRKVDDVVGETPDGWTESDSVFLKPADISTLRSNSSSKVKAYTTIR